MATSLTHPGKAFSTSDLHSLDVFRSGAQDMVEAAQIIARAAEALPRDFAARAVLTDAVFAKTTGNRVLCLRDEAPPPEGLTLIGEARFAAPSGRGQEAVTLRFAELAEAAERGQSAETFVYEPLAAPALSLSGDFAFAGLAGFEDLLSLIVETATAAHQAARPGFRDIRLAGCRQTALPVAGAAMTAGKLNVRHLALKGEAPLLRSTSLVELEGAGGGSLSAVVTFILQTAVSAS
ncbi:hypothetical protein HBA54_16270 [Pelagibius litoralis]|uniref:Uncharacterized protein n=1 Tax=Pelagibius litoralis TaxID=374515 RepID=A0A967EZA6_9PROT|nr:hypothetical protein [Pelagibius litoralis]NIA70163.1 hypothetical protein [Pelagibius litoralis]